MLALLSAVALGATEPSGAVCPTLPVPDDTVQVAWVSPVLRSARNNQEITVVLAEDLSAWSEAHAADQTRVLQALGMSGRRGGWRARRYYKVTLFEVPADELCRPLSTVPEGELSDGVRSCGKQRGRASCGLSFDTLTGEGGLPVYRIPWRDAARWGFCVVPLELYLAES